ncbi:MAG: hypothetical protein WDN69_31550 [Aliidongia sp.]
MRVDAHPGGTIGLALGQLDAAHRRAVHGGKRDQEAEAIAHGNAHRLAEIGLRLGHGHGDELAGQFDIHSIYSVFFVETRDANAVSLTNARG